jgi:hypothetical protein
LTLWALGDSLRAIGCVKISPLAILNRTNYTVGQNKMKSSCSNCCAPDRTLWVLFSYAQKSPRKPDLTTIEQGNWITLERCEECGALWCSSPYEPFASFPYLVAWPRDVISWRSIHDSDDGRTLLSWHAYEIAQKWDSLPEAERHACEAHRARSRGHNPIDDPSSFRAAPLPA